jgi:hypothetical protein
MQYIVTYDIDMCMLLPKISCKTLIFNSGYLSTDTVSLREQGCEDLWLLCAIKRGRRAKSLGNPGLRKLMRTLLSTTFNNEGLVFSMDCTNKLW